MADVFSIPLEEGAQTFTISLGGTQYRMTLLYREASFGSSWFLDMEKADGSDSVKGIPLVLGSDLLGQFQHKGFGHLSVAMDSGTSRPAYEDMGNTVTLKWWE